jgi:hypothetical protein
MLPGRDLEEVVNRAVFAPQRGGTGLGGSIDGENIHPEGKTVAFNGRLFPLPLHCRFDRPFAITLDKST